MAAGPTTTALEGRFDGLEERLRQVETKMEGVQTKVGSLDEFRKRAEPNVWFVTYARWVAGILVGTILTVIVGGCSVLQRFNKVEFASEDHAKRIEEQGARQEKQIDAQTQRIRELSDAQAKLRTNFVVVWNLQGKGPLIFEALVHHGKVLRVGPKEIVILPDDIGLTATLFPVPDSVHVRIDGKPAKLADLEPGMKVGVLTAGGKVESIDTEK